MPLSARAAELPVTSPFGWRIHPISGAWKFHSGVDLGYSEGAAIGALFSGEVVLAADMGDGYGLQVLIYHASNDSYTRYAHCSRLNVVAGQAVAAGSVIGLVGATGAATGAHLHLEYIVKVGGGYEYADPMILWGNGLPSGE